MFLELCFVALLHQAPSGPAQVGQTQSDSTQAGQAPAAKSEDGSTLSTPPDVAYEDQVLANLQHKDMGPVKLEALALPQEYLRRVGDRIIQSSFEEQFRIVVPDPKPGGTGSITPSDGASSGRSLWLKITGAVVGALFFLIGATIKRRRQAGAR